MNPWDADLLVGADLAAELATSTGLDVVSCRPFGEGWDNVAFLVNECWIFRFPRREVAIPWLRNELRVLPALGPLVGLEVPMPRWTGQPSDRFPRPFFGYRRLEGATLCRAGLPYTARRGLAATVGSFLKGLHQLPTDLVEPPPLDTLQRSDYTGRAELIRRRVGSLRARGLLADVAVEPVLADLLAGCAPHAALAWVHGDFYARHLMVSVAERRVTGVIDWGDVHLGDVALDLSIAWTAFDGVGREMLLDAYGPVDDQTLMRARFKALLYAVTFIAYGRDVADSDLEREGFTALEQVLRDRSDP